MFKLYRQAHDEMELDPAIQETRKAIALYQENLKLLETPYRERMAEAKITIISLVLEWGSTVIRDGVRATFKKGRRSPSWKSIAMALKPSQELIMQFTKTGKPSVSVSIEEAS